MVLAADAPGDSTPQTPILGLLAPTSASPTPLLTDGKTEAHREKRLPNATRLLAKKE